jgi:hypothetical protein
LAQVQEQKARQQAEVVTLGQHLMMREQELRQAQVRGWTAKCIHSALLVKFATNRLQAAALLVSAAAPTLLPPTTAPYPSHPPHPSFHLLDPEEFTSYQHCH